MSAANASVLRHHVLDRLTTPGLSRCNDKEAVMVAKAKTARKKSANAKDKSKKELVLAMLRRKNGACMDDLTKATSWQAHSVRGFLSGTVKKQLGLNLITERQESGVLRYFLRTSK